MTPIKYGVWRPDVPDHRDFLAKKSIARKTFVDRMAVNYHRENQGSLGSCTGNSGTSALELALQIPQVQLSRLFAYYTARSYEGTVKEDAGAQIRDVVKGLFKVGVPSETVWPYKIKQMAKKPSAEAYKRAAELAAHVKSIGLVYERVPDLKTLLSALSNGQPVVFGFMVPQQFDNMPKSYVLDLPKPKEPSLGGHAVFADGYDTRAKRPFVWVQNSWGKEWGLNGYFKMPFEWFTDDRRLVDDMWTFRRTK